MELKKDIPSCLAAKLAEFIISGVPFTRSWSKIRIYGWWNICPTDLPFTGFFPNQDFSGNSNLKDEILTFDPL